MTESRISHVPTVSKQPLTPDNQSAAAFSGKAPATSPGATSKVKNNSSTQGAPVTKRTAQTPETIIKNAQNEIRFALSSFLGSDEKTQGETLEAIRNILQEAKSQLTNKSLFGRHELNEDALHQIGIYFENLIQQISQVDNPSFLKLQELFAIQSELAKEELLAIGRSPEYKSMSKVINSLAQNINLVNHLALKADENLTQDDITSISEKFSENLKNLYSVVRR